MTDKIIWYDAKDHHNVSMEDIKKLPTSFFMCKRRNHGTVIKRDKFGIIILHDDDQDGLCEITAIPAEMVKDGKEGNKCKCK